MHSKGIYWLTQLIRWVEAHGIELASSLLQPGCLLALIGTARVRLSFSVRSVLADLHDHLDRVLDALARVADRGGHFGQGKGVGMDQLRVEALLRHQRRGSVSGALALAADAENVDVVAHEIGEVDRHRLRRKGGEADAAAAVDHA